MQKKRIYFSILLFLFYITFVSAQNVSGTIKDKSGELLSVASIFVEEINYGTIANFDGEYEISLIPGQYHLVFRYLGYRNKRIKVTIEEKDITLNVILVEQVEQLDKVSLSNKSEDMANQMIRNAQMMTEYNLLKVLESEQTVYIKGSFTVKEIPFLLKLKAKSEIDFEENVPKVFESVNNLKYLYPNTFKEKIISVRALKGELNDNLSPMGFLKINFYAPKNIISPISNKAFEYYYFKLINSYTENSQMIHKIQVIPKNKGEDVFEGMLYLREKHWDIYAIDFTIKRSFGIINFKQRFSEIEKDIFLPTTQKISGKIDYLGVKIDAKYLSSSKNYKIVVNKNLPKLSEEFKEDDKKIEEIKVIKKKTKQIKKKEIQKVNNQEIVKNLPKLNFVREFIIKDSAAIEDDSFWDSIRPVPLTREEKRGNEINDSIKKTKIKKDYFKAEPTDFFTTIFYGLFIESNYKISNTNIEFKGVLLNSQFNTVEGFNIEHQTKIRNPFINYGQKIRYGFASKQVYFKSDFSKMFNWNKKPLLNSSIKIEGGNYPFQISNHPIWSPLNSIYTLFVRQNYMKIYERRYIEFKLKHPINYYNDFSFNTSFNQRNPLVNNTDYSFFNENKKYTPNYPNLLQSKSISPFQSHNAFLINAKWNYYPNRTYGMRNNNLVIDKKKSNPEISVSVSAGIPEILNSKTDFIKIDFSLGFEYPSPINGLQIENVIETGSFLRNETSYIMDLTHFNTNQTHIIIDNTSINHYQLLPYYKYSTNSYYLSYYKNIPFRTLILTHIPYLRLLGFKEQLFFNYLTNKSINNYLEVGYSLNRVFGFQLRLVYGTDFHGMENYGIRIGLYQH